MEETVHSLNIKISAVSIAGPFLAIALAVGMMIATGGCALVSSQMGKEEKKRQERIFHFLYCSVLL